MSWGAVRIGGVEYDLTHLDPLLIWVQPNAEGARMLRVLVSFSHHVFTRAIQPDDDPAAVCGPSTDLRCFCPERFGLSLRLREIIKAAGTQKAFFPAPNHVRQRNFLLLEVEAGQPPYLIAFNLERAARADVEAVMFVVSAHSRPSLPPKSQMDSIRFATLVAKVVRGEAINRPPKKR
jgi:hypothetical protein